MGHHRRLLNMFTLPNTSRDRFDQAESAAAYSSFLGTAQIGRQSEKVAEIMFPWALQYDRDREIIDVWNVRIEAYFLSQSCKLLAYTCVEALVTVGSVITLTQAGLPDCRALSMAGAISSSLVTNSPYPPRDSTMRS